MYHEIKWETTVSTSMLCVTYFCLSARSGLDLVLRIDAAHDALLRRALGRRFDPVTGEHYHMDARPPPDDEVRVPEETRIIARTRVIISKFIRVAPEIQTQKCGSSMILLPSFFTKIVKTKRLTTFVCSLMTCSSDIWPSAAQGAAGGAARRREHRGQGMFGHDASAIKAIKT